MKSKTFKVTGMAFISYLFDKSCFWSFSHILDACLFRNKDQNVKSQSYLKVRFDFNSNVVKMCT